MRYPTPLGELALESLDRLTTDKPAPLEDAGNRRIELVAQRGDLPREVEKRNARHDPQYASP